MCGGVAASPRDREEPVARHPLTGLTEVPVVATETQIRVLVVDDHAVVREGIRSVLERQPGFEVVGEAADGPAALKLAQSTTPDVVVMDVSMPGGSGLR